jgi:hypothetical protein
MVVATLNKSKCVVSFIKIFLVSYIYLCMRVINCVLVSNNKLRDCERKKKKPKTCTEILLSFIRFVICEYKNISTYCQRE